jgi:hypothetical protein
MGLGLMDRYGDRRVNLNGDRWVNCARRVNNNRRFDDDVDLVSTHIVKDGVQSVEESGYFRQRLISLKLT